MENMDSAALSQSPSTNAVHVRRILGQLRDAGLVHSHAGAHGGWTLAFAPEAINMGLVWRAINGDDPLLGFHTPDPDCPTAQLVSSRLHDIDRRAVDSLVDQLSTVTVADILSGTVVTT